MNLRQAFPVLHKRTWYFECISTLKKRSEKNKMNDAMDRIDQDAQ